MQKFVLIAFIFLFSSALLAQNSTLPDAVSKSFEQKFPKAKKVKWSSENIDDYQAEFALDSLNCTALFSNKGSWQQTGIDVPVPKLMPSAQVHIKKNFLKSKVNRVTKIENVKRQIYYEVELLKDDELTYINFDESGNEITTIK